MEPDLSIRCEHCAASPGQDCHPYCGGDPDRQDTLVDLLMATT